MRKLKILAVALTCFGATIAQESQVDFDNTSELKMKTEYSSDIEEVRDVLSFEGIDYMRIKFSGTDLKGKSYHLTVKEIWDGKIVRDTTIVNSQELSYEQFQKINDTTFNLKVISKLTNKNKLKMTFQVGRIGFTREFDAIESDEYSLRNLADESNLEIGYNKNFYLLAYILPYEREDGSKSWCQVGTAGDDVEKWGEKFGIKHYLLFEMKFE